MRKGNALFGNEFFTMYLMQSTADIVTMFAVRSAQNGGGEQGRRGASLFLYIVLRSPNLL